ncbi:MAG: ATP-dependent protease subunit HslV [Candidatus Dormibacteria bacterium]|jgi:ATP-dependent HslUV protease subunit HslV
MTPRAHATTIVAVKRGNAIAVAGDGQVTVGDVVMKRGASKVRRMFHNQVVCGFAGAVSDALTLFDKFEQHLEKHQGNLLRAAVAMSREWRTDKYLRHLEANLIVAGGGTLLLLSGDGEVIEPDESDGVAAIGSGGPYAHAAARALLDNTDLGAEEIARRSLEIAAQLCIYTNDHITVETLVGEPDGALAGARA